MNRVLWLSHLFVRLPKLRRLFVALAHLTLIVVAKALLGPEGALSFQINLVCPEERRLLQPLQDGRNLRIKVLELLDWCACPIQIAFSQLGGAFWRNKRIWEVLGEELAAIKRQKNCCKQQKH